MTPIVKPHLPAAPWIARFIEGVKPGGRILDVACGSGRHLALGLTLGYRMVGVDRDIGPAKGTVWPHSDLELVEADLEDGSPFPFPPRAFDGVIVKNYLWRPILADIVASVGDDGVLIYETFGVGHERLGKPTQPDFLLRPGELLEAVRSRLTVIAYEMVTLPDPPRIMQRICAVGPRHTLWLRNPPAPIGPPGASTPIPRDAS